MSSICLAPVLPVRSRAPRPAPAARSAPAPARAPRRAPVPAPRADGGAPLRARRIRRQVHSRAPVRLTRRGRLAVLVLALAVLATATLVLGRAAVSAATSSGGPVTTTVVVGPGDTMWGVARRVAPHTDPRVTVARIAELNDLETADVRVGQRLVVPAG